MINDLLRDMIEIGDITVFIDNIMMKIETKKEYNDIVEKVLRKDLQQKGILGRGKKI